MILLRRRLRGAIMASMAETSVAMRKHLRSFRCLIGGERTSGRASADCQTRSQVDPQMVVEGIALARRPGSTVLRWNLPAGWLEQFSRAGKAGSVRMGRRTFLGPR